MTACFNEDTSGDKCQLDSIIQEVSGEAEEERSETSKGG